jgi:hypothetical protein
MDILLGLNIVLYNPSLCGGEDWVMMLTDSNHYVLYDSGVGFVTADDPYNGRTTGTFSSNKDTDTIYGKFVIENISVNIE